MRLVACLFLIWVYYALGQDKYKEAGITLRVPNCTAYGFFDHSIKLPGSKTKDCFFTCYCLAKNKARCKEYEPIICGNKVGIDFKKESKKTNNKDKKKTNKHEGKKKSKEDTNKEVKIEKKNENKRVKRAFGLGEIFFRDAVKETLNRAEPQQCKPYESSYSEGCPPDDWCVGCTVCDCDANGYWDCHNLSFCPDGKNGSEALKKPIKWQDYVKKPPIEPRKKSKKPKRPSKNSPNSKSRRRKIYSTTRRTVSRTNKPTTTKLTTKNVLKREAKFAKKESINKKLHEQVKKKIADKKTNPKNVTTKKINTKPTKSSKALSTKKTATTKSIKKTTTTKAPKKITTTVSPKMKLIEQLITDDEKASRNFTRELAQKIARRYIASIQKVITKNNDKLFASQIKQRINKALSKQDIKSQKHKSKRSKDNPNRIKTTTEKPKRHKTTPFPFVNEDENELFDRKKRCIHGNNTLQNYDSAELYDKDAHLGHTRLHNLKHAPYSRNNNKRGKTVSELRILHPVIDSDSNMTDGDEYFKYAVQTESGLMNTVTAPEPIGVENVTVRIFMLEKEFVYNNTLNKMKNESDQSIYYTSATSPMSEVVDGHYFSTSEKPSDVPKLAIANSYSYLERDMTNKSIENSEFDIPVSIKKHRFLNGTTKYYSDFKTEGSKNMNDNVDVAKSSTAINNIILPKYILDRRRPYYDPTKYARALISNILRNESEYENYPKNININNVKLIKDVCKIFGPCKINKIKKKVLKYKIGSLNNVTLDIFQILKTVKGLLKLMSETSKSNLKNDNTKVSGIYKLYYIDENNNNLTLSDKILLRYLKDNIHRFIHSFKEFAKILDTICKTITSPKKYDKKHDCDTKVRRFKVVKKLKRLTKTDNRSKDPIAGMTDLLLKYNVFQNTFMQNIYKKLFKIQKQIKDSKRMREKLMKEEREKVAETRKKIFETYTNRIKENLRKINDIAESINKTTSKRVKRSISNEDDLTIEYLLFLMEYLLRKNSQINRRSSDSIDYLIDAIERAPKIEQDPYKNEFHETRRKLTETATKIDIPELFVVTGAPQTFYSSDNKERVLNGRKTFTKTNNLAKSKDVYEETVEDTRDDYFIEGIVKNKFKPVTQMEMKNLNDKTVSAEVSAENEISSKESGSKFKEINSSVLSSSNEQMQPKIDNTVYTNTPVKPNSYEQPTRITEKTVYRNIPSKSNFNEQPNTAEKSVYKSTPIKPKSYEQPKYTVETNVYSNSPPKSITYEQPRRPAVHSESINAPIKPISHEQVKHTTKITANNYSPEKSDSHEQTNHIADDIRYGSIYEKNNETDDSYVTAFGKVLKADINDELINPIDYNVTNDIDNDSLEPKPKDEELINSFYKMKPIDGGIDNEDPYDKMEEDKGAGGGNPDIIFNTIITTMRPTKTKPSLKNIEFYDVHGGGDTMLVTLPKEDKHVTESSKVSEKKFKGEIKTKSEVTKIITTKPPPTRHPPITAPPKGDSQKKLYKTERLNSPRLVWVDESSDEENYTSKSFIASRNSSDTFTITTVAPTKIPERTRTTDLSDMTSFTKVIGSNRGSKKGDKFQDILKYKTMNLLNSLDYSAPTEKIDLNRDDSDSSEDKRGDDFSSEY